MFVLVFYFLPALSQGLHLALLVQIKTKYLHIVTMTAPMSWRNLEWLFLRVEYSPLVKCRTNFYLTVLDSNLQLSKQYKALNCQPVLNGLTLTDVSAES